MFINKKVSFSVNMNKFKQDIVANINNKHIVCFGF